MQQYDLCVIGAGPAGEKAALQAARHGASVAVIEKGKHPGGASVITGTIPSKSIRETVQYINSLYSQGLTGVEVHLNKKITIQELMYRKNIVEARRIEDIKRGYREAAIDYIQGEARFISPHELLVRQDGDEDTCHIHAKKIIIAVGTRPYRPADLPFDGKRVLDSDTILTMEHIPKSILIYGGGVIGCEYCSIFSKMGSRVHLIDPRGRLLDFLDHDISTALQYLMQESGVTLKLGEQYASVEVGEKLVHLHLKSGKKVGAEVMLFANGRTGNADLVDVEKAGLKMDSRNKLQVNDHYQTSVEHIYAVGDVIGFPSLASTSNEQGRLAADHAVTGRDVSGFGKVFPIGIYTIPEVAMIGKTEDELTAAGVPYEIGVCRYKELARGDIIGDHDGILKMIFHQDTRELLGVHILGPNATEIIHIGQAVMYYKGKLEYFCNEVFNFPTLSSAYKVAARDCLSRLELD
ncbi:MAG: Si-specific NAD(P)(+) transhydrogenase [Planctomycetota bacterium]